MKLVGKRFKLDPTTIREPYSQCGNWSLNGYNDHHILITEDRPDGLYYDICRDSDNEKVDSCNGCLLRDSLTPFKPKESKKPLMNRLSNMMKKLLDSDTQILVKAGFINGDLDLTSVGQDALYAVLFDTNKQALVDMAKIALTEEK